MAALQDVDKCRRDLYAVSLALLIFNVAGGSLAPDTPTVFGSIHITRQWVIAWGAWLLWLYVLWRFWLAAKPLWSAFLDDVDSEIYRTRAYRTHCVSASLAMQKHANAVRGDCTIPHGFSSNELPDLQAIGDNAGRHAREKLLFRLEPRTFGRRYVTMEGVRPHDLSSYGRLYNSPMADVWAHVVPDVPWSTRRRLMAVVRAIPLAVFRQEAFSDRILPLTFAVLALGAQVVRSIHAHGHLWR